ncbi:hypothetical protein Ms3S1_37460 [Methylosinus sp. 3S-1]
MRGARGEAEGDVIGLVQAEGDEQQRKPRKSRGAAGTVSDGAAAVNRASRRCSQRLERILIDRTIPFDRKAL